MYSPLPAPSFLNILPWFLHAFYPLPHLSISSIYLDSAVTFLQKKILGSFFDISFINLILLSGFLFNKQKYWSSFLIQVHLKYLKIGIKNDENKFIIKNIYWTLEEAQAGGWIEIMNLIPRMSYWAGWVLSSMSLRQFKVQIWNSGKISGWE